MFIRIWVNDYSYTNFTFFIFWNKLENILWLNLFFMCNKWVCITYIWFHAVIFVVISWFHLLSAAATRGQWQSSILHYFWSNCNRLLDDDDNLLLINFWTININSGHATPINYSLKYLVSFQLVLALCSRVGINIVHIH